MALDVIWINPSFFYAEVDFHSMVWAPRTQLHTDNRGRYWSAQIDDN
jgi:hypothetical protein